MQCAVAGGDEPEYEEGAMVGRLRAHAPLARAVAESAFEAVRVALLKVLGGERDGVLFPARVGDAQVASAAEVGAGVEEGHVIDAWRGVADAYSGLLSALNNLSVLAMSPANLSIAIVVFMSVISPHLTA